MITYSKIQGVNNTAFGKIETPVKMIIEHESDLLKKKGGVCEWLFNIEKSNRFGETVVGRNEFDVFRATTEGARAENDSINDTYTKFIEHIQFMKEFSISAEMMEDSVNGIAADTKRRAEAFTRAYYKTRNKLCEASLVNGKECNMYFSGARVDLTTHDNLPLFCSDHKWGNSADNHGTQSNFYYGDIFSTGESGNRTPSVQCFEEALSELCVKFRNMKDENGDALGYTPDTIILPGNRPTAEIIVKKVCGTNGAPGGNYNDINLHYGNWNIIILPGWEASNDSIMLMSQEANKNLGGNMFFNRVPLTITNWVDNHTGNYIWNGRCRFGIGFGTYKHIMLASDALIDTGTKL